MAKYVQQLKQLEMIQNLRIAYVLLEEEDWENLLLACDELGYDKSGILRNILQSFFKRHRQFYLDFGIADAEARGINSSQHFVILRDNSEDDLPGYKTAPPNPTPTPLDSIAPMQQKDEFKRKLNSIKLPGYNFVLLRNAHILHKDSYPQLISRIIKWHLNEYWEETYQPQIEREKKNDYI